MSRPSVRVRPPALASGSAKPRDGAGSGPDPDVLEGEDRELEIELRKRRKPLPMRGSEAMQRPHDRLVENVVAEQHPAGAQHPRGLGKRLFPVPDVMEHQEGENSVERAFVEGERGRVGLERPGPLPERSEPPARGRDHCLVHVGRGDAESGRSRSAQSSSMSSRPTLRRRRPGGTRSPSQRKRVSITESTPPRLVAFLISETEVSTLRALSPSATTNESRPPKPV